MDFLKGAKDLSRNPLGIIALFISLIYGFAVLLLNSNVEKFSPWERAALVIFIVLFPVIVLVAFYKLVTNHHGKLYAPADYQDDSSFLRTLTAEEQSTKTRVEVEEAFSVNEEKSDVTPQDIYQMPDYDDFVNEIKEIEGRVGRMMAREYQGELRMDVGIGSTGVMFDASIITAQKKVIVLDVKVVAKPEQSPESLKRTIDSAITASKYFQGHFKIIIVIVYLFEEDHLESFKNSWLIETEGVPVDMDVRFLSKRQVLDKSNKALQRTSR